MTKLTVTYTLGQEEIEKLKQLVKLEKSLYPKEQDYITIETTFQSIMRTDFIEINRKLNSAIFISSTDSFEEALKEYIDREKKLDEKEKSIHMQKDMG